MNVTVEIIEGNKYYSASDCRGNVTMVFVWDDQMYVQTNNSPAMHVEDVRRISKTAKALIEYVNELKEEKEEEIGNPRYATFVSTHGNRPNWEYMGFIAAMKRMYCGDSINGHISNQDDFTSFIRHNAHKWSA